MAKTPYLPPDIIEIILSKLVSVKPLLRFKSVSKSWNAIISDPVFIKNHHEKSKSWNSQDLFICVTRFPRRFALVKLGDKTIETVQVLEIPYYCEYILCRYDGVLLVTDVFWGLVLWDPSTRTHKQMSIPFLAHGSGSIFGLCPDPTTDGFKVVTMNEDNYSVYSTKNNSFIIDRKNFVSLYTDYFGGNIWSHTPVCVDGAVYWAVRGNIIYFDPRDDEFKVLQKPEYVKNGKLFILVDLGGSLCLYCKGEDETMIKIWVKEKGIDNNSWKELVTIENVTMSIWDLEPQCLVGNRIVMRHSFDTYDTNLVVYSPLEKTFEQLGPREFSSDDPGLIPYLDSPVITRCNSKRKLL